jgi:hypothetical protein
MEWSLESVFGVGFGVIIGVIFKSILNSILPIYNNTKQTQKGSNELKIVGGRLSSVLT